MTVQFCVLPFEDQAANGRLHSVRGSALSSIHPGIQYHTIITEVVPSNCGGPPVLAPAEDSNRKL